MHVHPLVPIFNTERLFSVSTKFVPISKLNGQIFADFILNFHFWISAVKSLWI